MSILLRYVFIRMASLPRLAAMHIDFLEFEKGDNPPIDECSNSGNQPKTHFLSVPPHDVRQPQVLLLWDP